MGRGVRLLVDYRSERGITERRECMTRDVEHGLDVVAVGAVLGKVEGVLAFGALKEAEQADLDLFIAPVGVDES